MTEDFEDICHTDTARYQAMKYAIGVVEGSEDLKVGIVFTFTRFECSFHLHSFRVQFSSSLVSSVVFSFTRFECSFKLLSFRV